MLGQIFAGAQSRFSNPVNLKRLITLIDETEWTALGVDVKAAVYEHLLEKAASEGKKGAGQYFTPRVLIQSIVRCMRPDPRVNRTFTVCDPACGTGGFLVAANEGLMKQTKGNGRMPYFSSGLFSFPEQYRTAEGKSFPQVWMDVAQTLDVAHPPEGDLTLAVLGRLRGVERR